MGDRGTVPHAYCGDAFQYLLKTHVSGRSPRLGNKVDVPEHLWRFPTREAIDGLARRFGLANRPDMQDWQWEVADPQRAEEFVAAYKTSGLTDDERFTLMEIILQSFEERPQALADDPVWREVLRLIEQNVELHIYSVWYWSCEDSDLSDAWRVAPFMREILARHRGRFAIHDAGGAK